MWLTGVVDIDVVVSEVGMAGGVGGVKEVCKASGLGGALAMGLVCVEEGVVEECGGGQVGQACRGQWGQVVVLEHG